MLVKIKVRFLISTPLISPFYPLTKFKFGKNCPLLDYFPTLMEMKIIVYFIWHHLDFLSKFLLQESEVAVVCPSHSADWLGCRSPQSSLPARVGLQVTSVLAAGQPGELELGNSWQAAGQARGNKTESHNNFLFLTSTELEALTELTRFLFFLGVLCSQ